MKTNDLIDKLNIMVPNPHCELEYNKDYEFLIAVVLSAQCTDKRVNMVTKKLFSKYSLKELSLLDEKDIIKEIHSLGSYSKKAHYIKVISTKLLEDYNGKVPNNRKYLESLPGVGRKTINVVLSELFDEPTIAVDTHVDRVAKRLGIAKENDDVLVVENKIMKKFSKEEYNRVNHQLLLLGRYTCLAKKPNCENCLIKCKYYKKKIK